jgi:hypothetical protein
MSWRMKVMTLGGNIDLWEDITEIARGLRIRAVLHGGVESIEFEIADDYVDAYRWAYDHIGADVYVFDNAANPPVAQGVILDPAISQRGTRIVAAGPFQAYCFRRVYNNTADWIAAGQTGAQLKDMLTDECPNISTNLTSVDEPGTTNAPWQPSDNSYPGDLIPGLAALSDANNASWYFWIHSAPMAGSIPTAPIAWFKAESKITRVYQAWRRDCSPGGLDLTSSLRYLANNVRAMYQDATGIQNQTASAADATSQGRWWLREAWDYDLGRATATAADQYRNLLLARYKDPQQSASFRLNTWLYDKWGNKWPLWRAIADFPFKFTLNDLIPHTAVLGHILDNKRTFITLAAEYDYDSNILTIVPDTEDNRADAMLARHRGLQ